MYEESLVSDIGRACPMEIGFKYRWWARYNHVCEKFGLWELVNLLWFRNISKEGMAMLGMEYDRNVWKKTFVESPGVWHEMMKVWSGMNEREQYLQEKSI